MNYIVKEKELVPQLIKLVKESGNYIHPLTALNCLEQHGFPKPSSVRIAFPAIMKEIAAMDVESPKKSSRSSAR